MSSKGPVVVTGAAGQLGSDVVGALDGREVVAVERSALDITDADAVAALFEEVQPTAVVNCAAYTAVDDCESNEALAFAVNADGAGNVARAAADVGAHVVHISTDYVFSGDKPAPYVEADPTDPQSVYGRSKLAGELAVGPDAAIVRTSWLCGEHGPNMVKTILRLADSHPTLRFVDDQRGHPSFTGDVAREIAYLLDHRHSGIFHVTNQGVVSWFEFAREVLAAAGHNPERVEPVSTADLTPPRPAPRPANSVLDNKALRDLGREPTRDFREPLAELVARLRHPG